MKNTVPAIYSRKPENCCCSTIYFIKHCLLFFLFFFLLLFQEANAQSCQIGNNTFILRAATCPGSVVFLQGSTPTGGNGTFKYQWQINDGDCGEGGFKDIPGATQQDYSVPASAADNFCYRRVVISGTCQDESGKVKIQPNDQQPPVAPTATVLQPTCAVTTGTITIMQPVPEPNQFYSIDGVTYTNTSGVFSNLNPGKYSVTVKYRTGCTSPALSVTINAPPQAPTGPITPASATICPGTNQVLTTSGGTSYQWYKDGVVIAGATSSTYSASAAGDYSADIINGACKGKSSNNATVTIAPTPTGTISPSTATVCAGTTVPLSVTGGATYQWYKDGVLINGATTSSYTATQSGIYTADIISSGGCKAKASNQASITVNLLPSGSISPANASICEGASITLVATGGKVYQWYKDGKPIANATSANYIATTEGTYTVEIDNGNCKANSSNSAVVKVLPLPVGSVSPASAILCPGSSISLSATGGNSYQWYKDGVLINGATSANYTATTPGKYEADIIVGNCKSLSSNASVITGATNPVGSISPASASICTGGSQLLTATSGFSYQWLYNGQNISGATSNTFTATQAGTYSVLLSNGTCVTPASNTAAITQTPTPTGSISPATASVCSGGSQIFTATGGTSYQWYKDGVAITGATVATYNATIVGTYTADIINGNCKGKTSNSAVLSIAPIPNGTISPSNATLCAGGSITLSVTGGTAYQWYRDGTAISGATTANYAATAAGTYTADIFNGTCKGTASNSAVVAIGASPSGTISPATGSICSGGTVVLTVSGGSSYQWYKDGTLINGATGGTYTASSPGTYTADIFSGTCKGKASNSAVLTTGTVPSGTISPASGTICSGNSINLSVTGGSSYQWYKDGVAINGATAATFTATTSGTYTADIINGNCKGKATNSAVIISGSSPTGSINASSTTICPGGTAVLTTTGGTSYQWFKDGVAITAATAATYTANQAGTYSVNINNGSCTAPASNTITITQTTAPSGTISPASASICSGGSIVLTASGGTTYQWARNGTDITGATSAAYTATQAGTYSVTISNGTCSGQASNTSTVSQVAPIIGVISPASSNICAGGATTLTATGGASYKWYRNGTLIPGAVSNTYIATQEGTYSVDLINGSCTGKASNDALVTVTNIPSGTISPANITLCPGTSATLTATGGATYQWYKDGALINGATASTYIATAAGTYTADINNGSCKSKAANSSIVIIGNSPVGTITPSSGVICGGVPVVLTIGGGTTYQWYKDGSPITGATSATYSASAPGTYTADIISGTCKGKATNDVVIINGITPTGSISPSSASFCSGTSQVLTVSGGSSYQWYKDGIPINGATASSFIATAAGVYTADILNGNCKGKSSNNATLTVTPVPSGSITPATGSLCTGASITISVSGGSSYQWYRDGVAISGATSSSFTASNPGNYSADIISGTCKVKASNEAVITAAPLIQGSITPASGSICIGGSQLLTATGGSSYQWARNGVDIAGATGDTYTATQSGTYSIIIKKGACSAPASNTVSITQNPTPTGNMTPAAAEICNGGMANFTATGGTAYQWYLDGTAIFGATSATLSTDRPGTYTADIFDAKGCKGKTSNGSVLAVLPLPAGNISPANLVICPGGAGTLTVNGGTSYQWYKDGVIITGATASTYSATLAGTYTADISNGKCSAKASNSAAVAIGSSPTGTIFPASATLCAGGSLVLTVSGGSSYQWYKDGAIINGSTGPSLTITNPGTYSADIISGTCRGKASNEAVISSGSLLTGVISPASITVCTGNSATLSVSGGSSYQWYKDGVAINGAISPTLNTTSPGIYSADILSGTCSGKASNTATVILGTAPAGSITPATANLCAGETSILTVPGGVNYQWYKDGAIINGATASTYTATQTGVYTADIINAGGCKGKADNAASVTIASVPSGSISPASIVLCSSESATVTATGGTSYQWYKDGVAIQGANQSNYIITDAGKYSADIFNASGCKGKANNEVTATVNNVITGTITPATASVCSGGSVPLTVTGGSSYQWYKDGLLIQGATSDTYTATSPGSYTADIKSGTCTGKTSNAAVITSGASPTGTISPASASICGGGSVTLSATGGTSYQWFVDGAAITGATANTYIAKQTGTYSVTIINGSCSGPAANVAIVSGSPAISFATATIDPNCSNPTGTITITNTSGGSGAGYLYSIDNGQNFQQENVFKNVTPGNYSVLVKDVGSCVSKAVTVSLKVAGSTLAATANPVDISCGQNSGSATINATGGVLPYAYSLNGGNFQSGNSFNNLASGTYKATVKDGGGCTTELFFSIKQIPSTLAATTTTKDAGCGQAGGSVTITATGGSPDFQYSLDGSAYQVANTFSNLNAGAHKATVKDKLGCTVDVSFDIKQSGTPPNLVITNPPNICAGSTTSLQSNAVTTGSDAGLTYTYWADAAGTSPLQNPAAVGAGTYYIKGTSSSGCFSIKPVVVAVNLVSAGEIKPAVAPNACNGETVVLTASQGNAYQWYRNDVLIPGATEANYKATEEGVYSVYISNGTCTGRASNAVTVRFRACIPTLDSKVFVPKAFTPNNNGANDALKPILYNIKELHYFKIYNRWGQIVFETAVMGRGWDGTIKGLQQPEETYSWILECVGVDGKIIKQSGKSLLIR